MNTKHFLVTFLALVCIGSSYANAQKFKYAYVDFRKVINQMPEKRQADSLLQIFVAELEAEVKKMQNEYVTKANAYKQQEAGMSEIIKKTKADELNSLNKRIQDFQVEAQKEIQKKQQELYKPVREKFNEALEAVVDEQGYRFVIDNSEGMLLYKKEEDNAEKYVLKELGIK